MALIKQTIPISLFKGIDTKGDNKNDTPGEMRIVENGVFTNPGKIRKRNGFTALPRFAVDGNVSAGKALSSYNAELVQFTGRDVLGFSITEQSWINRGVDYSLESEIQSIVNNNNQQRNAEMKIAFGLELYAWEDSSGGVRYSLIDTNNKSVLVANAECDKFGFRPKVVVWNGLFVILYSLGTNIFARTIDPAAPFIISTQSSVIVDLNPNGPQFDAFVNIDGVFYIGYAQNQDGYSAVAIVSGLSVADTEIHSFNNWGTAAVALFADEDNNLWFLTSGNQVFGVAAIFLDVGGITEFGDNFTIQKNTIVNRCMGYENKQSGQIIIFFEVENDSDFNFGNIIYKSLVSIDGTVFTTSVFRRGLGLYSKVFNNNNDYFFALTFDTPLQATYIIVNEAGNIVDRTNVNNGGGNKNNSNDTFHVGVCTDTVNPLSGIFKIPFQVKTSIESNGGTTFLPTGINVDTYDFNKTDVFGNVFTSQNINVVGGIYKNYDGVNYAENNFLCYPEGFFCDNTNLTFSIVQFGGTITPQITSFTIPPAYRIPANSYFTITSTTTSYYIWFRKDGIGIDPNPGGAGFRIDINSTDISSQVAAKIQLGLPSAFTADLSGNLLIIHNEIDGAVQSPPTSGNVNTGNLGVGTYLYNVLYSWVDNNGIVQRSETAVPVSINVETANASVSIIVPTLRITEKKNVRIDIYRTEGTNFGSTLYYRISPIDTGVFNDASVDFVSFIDTLADEDILSNDLIYTTGGVLDNASPPSSSMCVLYKNRVFIGGLDDPNLLWFSKYVFEGIPVQFSEFLTFKCDPRGGDITALGALDDKLIIFKETCMFALVGNGPTDTGDSNDYDAGATLISTDIGCSNSNSVVIVGNLGLLFKSNKGIYLLGRDLSVSYVGAAVEEFNDFEITSAVQCPNNNQIRLTTLNGPMLVYDYFTNNWSTNTNLEATDAHFVDDTYYLLRSDGIVYEEDPNIFTDNGEFIKLRLKTGWICLSGRMGQTSGIQGFQRVWRAHLLGSYYGPHELQVSLAYDYNDNPSEFTTIDAATLIGDNEPWGQSTPWGNDEVWGGNFVPYQWRIHLTKQKCETIQITIEDNQESNFNEGFDLSNISLEVGTKQGNNKLPVKNSFGNK